MEFTNKRPAKPEAAEIQLRLLNWPDSYYRERDPKIRLEILDAADARGLTPAENELRRKLFHLRYPGVEKGERDLFIKAALERADEMFEQILWYLMDTTDSIDYDYCWRTMELTPRKPRPFEPAGSR